MEQHTRQPAMHHLKGYLFCIDHIHFLSLSALLYNVPRIESQSLEFQYLPKRTLHSHRNV
jgi:hypothetical protein